MSQRLSNLSVPRLTRIAIEQSNVQQPQHHPFRAIPRSGCRCIGAYSMDLRCRIFRNDSDRVQLRLGGAGAARVHLAPRAAVLCHLVDGPGSLGRELS